MTTKFQKSVRAIEVIFKRREYGKFIEPVVDKRIVEDVVRKPKRSSNEPPKNAV